MDTARPALRYPRFRRAFLILLFASVAPAWSLNVDFSGVDWFPWEQATGEIFVSFSHRVSVSPEKQVATWRFKNNGQETISWIQYEYDCPDGHFQDMVTDELAPGQVKAGPTAAGIPYALLPIDNFRVTAIHKKKADATVLPTGPSVNFQGGPTLETDSDVTVEKETPDAASIKKTVFGDNPIGGSEESSANNSPENGAEAPAGNEDATVKSLAQVDEGLKTLSKILDGVAKGLPDSNRLTSGGTGNRAAPASAAGPYSGKFQQTVHLLLQRFGEGDKPPSPNAPTTQRNSLIKAAIVSAWGADKEALAGKGGPGQIAEQMAQQMHDDLMGALSLAGNGDRGGADPLLTRDELDKWARLP